MENFFSSNSTTCSMDGGSSSSGSSSSSLTHDLYIMTISIIGTCIAVASYNYYIYLQLRASKRRSAVENAQDDEFKDQLILKKKTDDLMNKKFGAMMSSKNQSIASSLAYIEGVEASGNFLSGVFSQMWNHLNIAVSNTIKDTLEPSLRDMKPVSLHFVRLDLGDVPFLFQNMFIHRVDMEHSIAKGKKKKAGAGVQIDVDVVWDGNCDIMLQANFTKSAKFTFGVKQIKLSGRLQILLSPLTTEIPVISAVQYGFINPPDVQLSFSGVAQSVTSKLGVVKSTLLSVIQSSLADMLVLPNRMVMPMDLGHYDYFDTYQAPVGMVRVTVLKGRGFKVLQKILLKDIPDVYCKISLGASQPFRTSTQYDNVAPSWREESCDFILYDMDQKVHVEVFDEDKTPVDPDDPLGNAEISVRDLFRNDGKVVLELDLNGEKTECFVTLSAELFHLADQLQSLSSLKYEGKNQLCGLATIIVTKAFDIPIPKEDAATYVKVVYGESTDHEKTFYTGTVVDYPGFDALNPMYDCVFHVPITVAMLKQDIALAKSAPSPTAASTENGNGNRLNGLSSSMTLNGAREKKKANKNNDIVFTLMDTDGANGTTGHGELGKMTITHESLLKAYKHTITETRPIGDRGAKLEYRIRLSGMQCEEEFLQGVSSSQASDEPLPPQSLYGGIDASPGVKIRVTAMRGRGFDVRKRRFGKKDDVPDVYCSIQLNSSHKEEGAQAWKTPVIKDDTMPQWNESKDFDKVDPARDLIRVDVFDENRKGKDEYLGSAEFSVEKLLRKRMMEVELKNGTTMTDTYVTFRCIHMSTVSGRALSGSINTSAHNVGASLDDFDEEENDDVVAPLRSSHSTQPPRRLASVDDSYVRRVVAEAQDESDDFSVTSLNSTSSTSSRSRKMVKNLNPMKLGKSLSKRMGRSKRNTGEHRQTM
ncbi:hypothetical protein ACHAXR_012705 [Thalassiosira sp. AJA248-18]